MAAQNHGLPRFRGAAFATAYPFGQVILSDPDVPSTSSSRVSIRFVPTDVAASSWPIAVLRFEMTNRTTDPLTCRIAGCLQNFIGSHNTTVESDNLYGVLLRSNGVDPTAESWGSLALAILDGEDVTRRTAWTARSWGETHHLEPAEAHFLRIVAAYPQEAAVHYCRNERYERFDCEGDKASVVLL